MGDKVAIIGMSGRFPDASNINALLENLKKGKKSSATIKESRLKSCGLSCDRDYFQGAFLDEIDKFDYKFFGILKNEASLMCPSQRMLLETVYEAVENAAYNYEQLKGSRTAIFVTRGRDEYFKFFKKRLTLLYTGGMNSFAFSRIANFFDWSGMANIISTNCSSGLVAIHSACRELISGDADYAVVCGAYLYLLPYKEKPEFDDNIVSQEGISCPFSEQANGMTRGESVVALLLKPLEKAMKDGDIIHSVIDSTSVNNNASQNTSLVKPDARSQAKNLKRAIDKAGINLNQIGYIEAHGSGTKLGDSIEIDGFNMVFEDLKDDEKIQLSNVKANIGHSMSSSGLSGLVRAVLSVENGYIFPTADYKIPSRVIDFESAKVKISQQLKKWSNKYKKRIAIVSAIGLSGVNAHIVVSEAPKQKRYTVTTTNNNKSYLITCSAKSSNSLKLLLLNLSISLNDKRNSLSNISYTLNYGRAHYEYRFAVIVNSKKSLKKNIKEITKDNRLITKINDLPKVIFLFSEYSSIPKSIISYLLKNYKVFRHEYEQMISENNAKDIKNQNFAYQLAFMKLLSSFGVVSNDFIGVGLGDMVCDVAMGKFSLQTGEEKAKKYLLGSIDKIKERINSTIKNGSRDGNIIFVPLGHTNTIIKKFIRASEKYKTSSVINLKINEVGHNGVLCLVRDLYLSGVDIDWRLFVDNFASERIELPTYKFDRVHCWSQKSDALNFDGQSACDDKNNISKKINKNLFFDNVCTIWKDVLLDETIDLQKSFFENGGDSLQATSLIRKLNSRYGTRLDFEDIYSFSTITKQVQYLEENIDIKSVLGIIWMDVLDLKSFKKEDDFFELGGHSLLATQLFIGIKNNFDVEVTFDDFYRNSSFEKLFSLIKKRQEIKENIDITKFHQKQEKNTTSVIEGGVPLTEISEWINFQHFLSSHGLVVIECKNLVLEKIYRAVNKVRNLDKHISFYSLALDRSGEILQNNLSELVLQKETSLKKLMTNINKNLVFNPKEKELNIMVAKVKEKKYLIFLYNMKKISFDLLCNILREMERNYNSQLISPHRRVDGLREFFPEVKLPGIYGCEYSSILSMLKWIKKDFFYYKSLFPALNFACLPNLYFLSNEIIRNLLSSAKILGYEDIYEAQNIFIEDKFLKSKIEAEKYYNSVAENNSVVMIYGLARNLFYSRIYKNDKHQLSNVSLLIPRKNKNPLVYSPNLDYFGDFPKDNLWEFWRTKNSKSKKNQYRIINILESSKIVSHNKEMLFVALTKIIDEYFCGQIIRNDDTTRIYFGESAYSIYEKNIQDSANKEATTPDIFLLESVKVLERSLILFRDFLLDLSIEKCEFNKYVGLANSLIALYEDLFFNMSKIVKNKNIDYEPRISTLPDKGLCKLKIFTVKQKIYLLEGAKKIHAVHNKMMAQLKDFTRNKYN